MGQLMCIEKPFSQASTTISSTMDRPPLYFSSLSLTCLNYSPHSFPAWQATAGHSAPFPSPKADDPPVSWKGAVPHGTLDIPGSSPLPSIFKETEKN